jgi:hypothetical protein
MPRCHQGRARGSHHVPRRSPKSSWGLPTILVRLTRPAAPGRRRRHTFRGGGDIGRWRKRRYRTNGDVTEPRVDVSQTRLIAVRLASNSLTTAQPRQC